MVSVFQYSQMFLIHSLHTAATSLMVGFSAYMDFRFGSTWLVADRTCSATCCQVTVICSWVSMVQLSTNNTSDSILPHKPNTTKILRFT